MSTNGLKPPPSFSSFPDNKPAPAFDSFPEAGPSRSASHSETEEERRERKRRKREKQDVEYSKRSSKHSNRRAEERDGNSKKSRYRDDVDRKGKGRERDSKGERRRSRSRSPKERKHREHRSIVTGEDKYYNTLDLASGESHESRSAGQDGFSDLPDYKVFSVDRKGDQDVRRYGKLYRGSVPSYRRLGFGNVIGLNGEFKISRESAYTGQGLEVMAGRDTSKGLRLGDRNIQLRITDRSFRRITLAPKSAPQAGQAISTLPVDDDYLPLPRGTTQKEKLAQLEQEDGQDYRSVVGLVKDGDLDESDDALEVEDGGESYDEYVKRRNREFERHLRADPTDAKTWLDLVAFQDEVHGNFAQDEARSRRRTRTVAERRSIAEVKISVLERALDSISGPAAVKLQLALMGHGSDIWDTKELMKRWQDLLRANPGSMQLWIEYVSFRQTAATVFTVQDTVDVYADCLSRLSRTALASPRSSKERSQAEENMVYLLLRVCLLLRQADYPERALAALQAMIELNFQCPDQHRQAMQADNAQASAASTALDDLELFWDSEAPRFGEPGAKGWRNTEDGAEAPATLLAQPPPAPSEESDPFQMWAAREFQASARRQHPSRTTDDPADEDDPYSTILFGDIRPLLFFVSTPDARSQLLYSFLFYLGLPLTPPDTSTATPLSSDPFLHSDDFLARHHAAKRTAFWPADTSESFLRSLIPFDTVAGEAMEPVRAAGIKDPFETPFRRFPTSPDLLYRSVPRWFCLLPQRDDAAKIDVELVRNALAQMRTFSKDIFLTLAYFSYEASLDPKRAIKTAKGILKQDSNSLLLWDAYARIELSTGNKKMTRTVYANALALAQSFDDEKSKMDMPLLWRAWVELEWEDGRLDATLAVLTASSKPQVGKSALDAIAGSAIGKPGQAALLTAKSHYRQLLDKANRDDAPQALFRHRVSIAFCAGLLAYLAEDLDAAMALLGKQIVQLQSEAKQSAEEEEMLAIQAKILFRHTQTRTAFRPGQLRNVLEGALTEFPNNSIFLSLYFYNELRTRIENRVRRTLDELVLEKETVTTEGWLFAIYAELHLNARGYNAEAVRNLFERAVESTRTRSSISIWSLFIEFELRQGNPRRAKTLLQRALVECPWAKDLYMMAFTGSLRSAFRSAELRNVHRLLLEKRIRLHVSLDDLASGWKSEESEDDEMEEETEDALYAQSIAAERQRLLPM